MDTTKKSNEIEKQNKGVEFYNDQIGENASEEYKSEKYANAFKNDTENKKNR